MRELLLVRFGEIFLKGLNRPYFMKELVKKIRYAVQAVEGQVWLHDSRVFVSDYTDQEECIRRVTKVFGVHSVCPAVEMEKDDFAAICAQASAMMTGLTGTFKVYARRSDKRYPMDSGEINRAVGGYILEHHPDLRVDVHEPQHRLNVEIRDKAYLYVRVVPAVGGMPVGTNGRATLLLSGGIDSPVAGWMIAKRGVKINAVHFHSYPYTSDRAKEKVLDLARILSESCCGIRAVSYTQLDGDKRQMTCWRARWRVWCWRAPEKRACIKCSWQGVWHHLHFSAIWLLPEWQSRTAPYACILAGRNTAGITRWAPHELAQRCYAKKIVKRKRKEDEQPWLHNCWTEKPCPTNCGKSWPFGWKISKRAALRRGLR